MVKKSQKSDNKPKETKNKASNQKKPKWSTKSTVVGVIVAITIVALGYMLFSISSNFSDENQQSTYDEQLQQDSTEQGAAYISGEKTAGEVADYWGSVAENEADNSKKADVYYKQAGYFTQDKQYQKALETLQKIIVLDSNFSKLTLYDALGGAAADAGENVLAIGYYEEMLIYFEQENSEEDFYIGIRADYLSLIEELK